MSYRTKPRWVILRENEEARRAAARDEQTHNLGAALYRQEQAIRSTILFQTVRRQVIAQVANIIRDGDLRALGGFTAIINGVIAADTTTARYAGDDNYRIAKFLNVEIMDIRNAAIKEAGL